MTLYLQYRPQSFDDVQGNKSTVDSLKSVVKKDNPPHSYLFYGPTGCGKTTLARILAKEFGCTGDDFHEIDSADFRGIDTAREIRKLSRFAPLHSNCIVWLIDECHKMTNDAQNALLKALEDTPSHVYFILATTEPEKLIKTIKGRCSQFQVNTLSDKEMTFLLRRICKAEGATIEKEVRQQIVQDSLGHPRNALQILEQVLDVEPEKRLEVAKRSAEIQSQTIELCRVLIQGGSWKKVSKILNGLKDQEPESIRRAVLGYCSAVLLKEQNDVAAQIMEEMIEPFYNTGFPGLVFACYSIVKYSIVKEEVPF